MSHSLSMWMRTPINLIWNATETTKLKLVIQLSTRLSKQLYAASTYCNQRTGCLPYTSTNNNVKNFYGFFSRSIFVFSKCKPTGENWNVWGSCTIEVEAILQSLDNLKFGCMNEKAEMNIHMVTTLMNYHRIFQ